MFYGKDLPYNKLYKYNDYELIYYINDVTIANEEVLVEYNESGVASGTYEYGNERLSVEYANHAKEYYLYNGTGNVVQTTAQNSSVFLRYTYDPFGNITGIRAPFAVDTDDINRYTYNGEDYDYTTGLQYLRARYYNTSTGSFISQDTYLGQIISPLSQNRYTYCHNNPVMYDDPSGHSVQSEVYTRIYGYQKVSNNLWSEGLSGSNCTYLCRNTKDAVNKIQYDNCDNNELLIQNGSVFSQHSATYSTYKPCSMIGLHIGVVDDSDVCSGEEEEHELIGGPTFDLGFGIGLGGEFEVFGLEVSIMIKYDYFHIIYRDGCWDIGNQYYFGMEVEMDAIPGVSFGISESKFHSYYCPVCSGSDFPGSCPGADDLSDDFSPNFGFGLSSYFIYGLEINVGYEF